MKGVKAAGVAKDGAWTGGVFGSYHLLQYTDANGVPVVRVQLSMKNAEPLKIEKEPAGLRLVAGESPHASSAAVAPVAPTSVAKTASETTGKPSAHGLASVSGVSIKSGPAGETYVDIATTHPTAFNVLHLSDPARLVVDFQRARTGTSQRSVAGNSQLVKSVRVGQFRENPAVARVVADLVGDPAFDVHAQSGGVRVELKRRSALKPVAAASPVVAAPPATKSEEKPVETAKAAPAPPAEAKAAEAPATPLKAAEAVEVATSKAAASTQTPATHTAVDIQSMLPSSEGSSTVAAAPKAEAPADSPEAVQAARAALTMVGSSGTVYSAA
ncbi:MAG: AMIN domain-containing protein, partial [Burkholderiales bacterium]